MKSKQTSWRLISAFLTVAVFLTVIVTPPAQVATAAPAGQATTPDSVAPDSPVPAQGAGPADLAAPGVEAETDAEASQYWTLERMRAAQAAQMPSGSLPREGADDADTADAGRAPGSTPAGGEGSGAPLPGMPTPNANPSGEHHGFFQPYAPNPPYTGSVLRTIGRVFFRTALGRDSSCSASSIGNYGVLTAGHCVHAGSGGRYHTSFIFVPAYNGRGTTEAQVAPYGRWSASRLITTGGWANSSDFRYDWGAAVLRTNGGSKISQRVGWLGAMWDFPRQFYWYAMGYPSEQTQYNRLHDGKTQKGCLSDRWLPNTASPSTTPTYIRCNLTGGASGGPWITNYQGQWRANGVNSFANRPQFTWIATPYPGTSTGYPAIIRWAQGTAP